MMSNDQVDRSDRVEGGNAWPAMRPMTTAPRDGTHVLAVSHQGNHFITWGDAASAASFAGWWPLPKKEGAR